MCILGYSFLITKMFMVYLAANYVHNLDIFHYGVYYEFHSIPEVFKNLNQVSTYCLVTYCLLHDHLCSSITWLFSWHVYKFKNWITWIIFIRFRWFLEGHKLSQFIIIYYLPTNKLDYCKLQKLVLISCTSQNSLKLKILAL